MTNKRFWLGMLAMTLVFGMAVVGCKDGGESNIWPEESDIWSNVTSFSQVNGTWKAPSTVIVDRDGMKIMQQFTDYTITFNAVARTMLTSGSGTTTITGENIDTLWSGLKESLESDWEDFDGVTVNFNDANHSYTITCNNFSLPLTDEELAELGLQINQDGKKLKVWDYTDIIYTKQ